MPIDMPRDLPMETVIEIIEEVESGRDVWAIGDAGKAYGILQIQQPCLDDYNKWNGTKYVLSDLLGSRGAQISHAIFKDYMAHYATEKRLGHQPTIEDYGRIWNGGPNGHKKSVTQKYGLKVISLAKKYIA